MSSAHSVIRSRQSLVRDAIIAIGIFGGLYGLTYIPFQPLQIPGYLLILGFDLLEGSFGSMGANYEFIFAVYLIGLSLLSSVVAHVLRGQAHDSDQPRWQLGVAGALAVVGTVSLAITLGLFVGSGQVVPGFITGTASLIMLGLAGWLSGMITVGINTN